MAEVQAMGLRMIPIIVIDDHEPIVGFNPAYLQNLLGITQKAQSATPQQTLAAHDKVLAALQRAVRQIPDTQLSFKTPDRDRSLQEHVWHIFRFAELALIEGAETGSFHLPNPMGSFAEEASPYLTSESIAQYGENTRTELRKRLLSEGDAAFDQVVETYAGPMRLGDMVPWIANHSAHHLRQLYAVMEMLNLAPDARLAVVTMPEITVLEKLW